MHDNSNLSVLVIDPNPGMRGSLQNMLVQSNITKLEFAVSSGTAIRQLSKRSFDIVLCEYDLGSGQENGQDGQQLLEDLRHHKLIGLWTIFIMITSEGVYSKVVSAAELTPTDYILKPFTVDVLSQRIDRAIERRTAFLPVYQMIGQGNLREAIKACAAAESAQARYATEFARLRAELHMSLGELNDAESVYAAILAAKPAGWAQLGLARALFEQDRVEEAEAALTKLIADNPKFMAAYDLLARCYEARGVANRAQRVLEDAVAISPHMVRRLRRLGEVALDAGDPAMAEKSFKQVVAKAKYSEFRDPEDHVNLVRALVKKGDSVQAGGVVRDLEKSMRGNPNTDVCKAVALGVMHEASGNKAGALSELTNAVKALRGSTGLSGKLRVGLVRSCLNNRLDDEASEVMLGVMNDVNGGVSTQQAIDVFVKAGRADLAEGIGARLKVQVLELMNLATEKTNMGDLKGAVHTLLEALHMAPSNLQVMLALVGAILRQLGELGWDHPLGEQCRAHIETIRKLDPAHPRLAELHESYLAARRNYGLAG